jgi:hypothetical protein
MTRRNIFGTSTEMPVIDEQEYTRAIEEKTRGSL